MAIQKEQKIATPYLEDIISSIQQIETYVAHANMSYEEFIENTQVQDAVLRRLEIIGEAAKRLESDFREKYDKIPWRQMSGLRDVLIHDYDQVDLDQVWQVIKVDIPVLKERLKEIV